MKKRISVAQAQTLWLLDKLAEGKSLVTFDVFDTVVTRCVGEPTSAFLLLGRLLHNQGLLSCSPQDFAQARTTTEIVARLASPTSEVTIDAIYQRVQDLNLLRNA